MAEINIEAKIDNGYGVLDGTAVIDVDDNGVPVAGTFFPIDQDGGNLPQIELTEEWLTSHAHMIGEAYARETNR